MLDTAEHRSLQDPAGLAANRRGKTTPEQQAVFRAATRASGCGALALLGGALFVGVPSLCLLSPLVVPMEPAPHVPTGGQLLAAFLVLVAAGALWLSSRYWRRLQALRREIAGGAVVHATGRVVWRDVRYAAEIPGRSLRVYGQMDLVPGEYTFYFLADSGYLLSAEPAGAPDTAAGHAQLLAALAAAHRFTPADLPENRSRRMAQGQRAGLVRALAAMLALAVVPVIVTVFLLVFFAPWHNPGRLATGLLCAFVFVAVLVLLGTTAFVWQARRLVRDLRTGEVDIAEGIVHKYRVRERRRSGGTRYYYRLDRVRLAVGRIAYNALVAGQRYRVYFAPHSRTVVAVEPL